jgi:hypothetical protein
VSLTNASQAPQRARSRGRRHPRRCELARLAPCRDDLERARARYEHAVRAAPPGSRGRDRQGAQRAKAAAAPPVPSTIGRRLGRMPQVAKGFSGRSS